MLPWTSGRLVPDCERQAGASGASAGTGSGRVLNLISHFVDYAILILISQNYWMSRLVRASGGSLSSRDEFSVEEGEAQAGGDATPPGGAG